MDQVTQEEFDQFEKAEAREAIGGKAEHNQVWQTSVNKKLPSPQMPNASVNLRFWVPIIDNKLKPTILF